MLKYCEVSNKQKNDETVQNERSSTQVNYKRKGRNSSEAKFKIIFNGDKRKTISIENKCLSRNLIPF